jgi:hypothetical protein
MDLPEFVDLVEDPDLVRDSLCVQKLFHVRSKLEQLLESVTKRNENAEMVLRDAQSYTGSFTGSSFCMFLRTRWRVFTVADSI